MTASRREPLLREQLANPHERQALTVPVWTLTAESHYILSVRDAATADQTPGEYRFAVAAR